MDSTPSGSGPSLKPRFGRRIYLINRRLQLGVLLYSFCIALVVSLLHAVFDKIVIGRMDSPFSLGGPILVAFTSSLVIFTMAMIYGLYLTNRIAGPIHRLRLHMEQVAAGTEREPLQFRQGDFFAELLEPYNKIIATLENDRKTDG